MCTMITFSELIESFLKRIFDTNQIQLLQLCDFFQPWHIEFKNAFDSNDN